ncbi:hypothetical protein FB451DRAFT_1439836 [Mycena latifolia]|nr:hypothetical protein FB451DRAFT_1439836 [Mycena latifolia]
MRRISTGSIVLCISERAGGVSCPQAFGRATTDDPLPERWVIQVSMNHPAERAVSKPRMMCSASGPRGVKKERDTMPSAMMVRASVSMFTGPKMSSRAGLVVRRERASGASGTGAGAEEVAALVVMKEGASTAADVACVADVVILSGTLGAASAEGSGEGGGEHRLHLDRAIVGSGSRCEGGGLHSNQGLHNGAQQMRGDGHESAQWGRGGSGDCDGGGRSWVIARKEDLQDPADPLRAWRQSAAGSLRGRRREQWRRRPSAGAARLWPSSCCGARPGDCRRCGGVHPG